MMSFAQSLKLRAPAASSASAPRVVAAPAGRAAPRRAVIVAAKRSVGDLTDADLRGKVVFERGAVAGAVASRDVVRCAHPRPPPQRT